MMYSSFVFGGSFYEFLPTFGAGTRVLVLWDIDLVILLKAGTGIRKSSTQNTTTRKIKNFTKKPLSTNCRKLINFTGGIERGCKEKQFSN